MKSKRNQHNRNVLKTNNEETTRSERRCNCPKNVPCPMNGYCLEKDLARIKGDLPNYVTKEYKGIYVRQHGWNGLENIKRRLEMRITKQIRHSSMEIKTERI